MKIDGMDWMDWLHKMRAESEAERKRLGISGVEWLRMAAQEAEEIRRELELARRAAPVARNRNSDE